MSAERRGPFATDLEKYYAIAYGGSRAPLNRIRLWVLNDDFHCVVAFRAAQASRALFARNKPLGLLPLMITGLWRRRISKVHHVTIDRRARIGSGLFVMHRNGIFIGPVVIGDNCVLHHNVTIGQRVAAGGQGVPSIGHNVWIGPGVTITGDITVGDGVTISAGTVLSKSVPDGSLVAGNPGRVIQCDYDNSAMINFTVPGRVQHVPLAAAPDPVEPAGPPPTQAGLPHGA